MDEEEEEEKEKEEKEEQEEEEEERRSHRRSGEEWGCYFFSLWAPQATPDPLRPSGHVRSRRAAPAVWT